MNPRRIALCGVQVPFTRGGAELLVETLRDELQGRGCEVEVVSLPFKWYPKGEVLKHSLAWRLLDLTESNGKTIDLVIATKFPSYAVRHPNKVTWLVQQFRQAYDLYGTPYGDFTASPEDERVRQAVIRLDNAVLPESRKLFAISENVRSRLLQYNGIQGQVLYPPPRWEARFCNEGYGDFVLHVGRLEPIKRADLLIRAMAHVRSTLRCLIVGSGPDRARLEHLAGVMGVTDRVEFLGYIKDEDLIHLYGQCGMVFAAPYDEDYGYVAVEAFKAEKPVVTTRDAGGLLEFVRDGWSGFVVEPEPEAIADKLDLLYGDRERCAELGRNGWEAVREIRWDKVVDVLLS